MFNKKLNWLILIAIIPIIFGCKSKGTEPNYVPSKEKLTINLSLKPAIQSGYSIARINAKIKKGSFVDSLDLTITSDSAYGEFRNLTPGIYEIIIKAYNEQNYLIAEGSGTAEILPGKTSIVNITLTLLNGNLIIIVNWNFQIPQSGLVAHYPFENNLNDVVGSNNGILFGNSSFEDGIKGKGIRFYGVDNQGNIVISNSNNLSLSNNFTLTFWLNIKSYKVMNHWGGISNDGFGGGHCIFSKSCDINGLTISVGRRYSDSLLVLDVENGKTNGIHRWLTGNSFTLNKWVFFGIVITNDRIKLYQDGILVADTTLAWFNLNPQTSSNDIYIGKNSCGFYPMNGIIDELRVYNRPLSEREIRSLYFSKS